MLTQTTPLNTRVLAMIALFEGSANGHINVWDEQYLSLGTLHFAVGQGVGARFLMRVYQLDPAGTLACLGQPFVTAIKGGIPAIQAFCRANVWKTGEKWQPAFTALWRLDAYKQADTEFSQSYLDDGRNLARRYGLTTERGLAWAVDRCVQQGAKIRPQAETAFAGVRGRDEQTVMVALARAYANTASAQYVGTVMRRSLTVATGSSAGTGYPGSVNLEHDFCLSLSRPWNAPALPNVFMRDQGDTEWIPWNGVDVPYSGQTISKAWVGQMALAYPPGTNTKVGSILLSVAADGALMLKRA